jgi:hypothetical protein
VGGWRPDKGDGSHSGGDMGGEAVGAVGQQWWRLPSQHAWEREGSGGVRKGRLAGGSNLEI